VVKKKWLMFASRQSGRVFPTAKYAEYAKRNSGVFVHVVCVVRGSSPARVDARPASFENPCPFVSICGQEMADVFSKKKRSEVMSRIRSLFSRSIHKLQP
jgi:hypothetical protein